MKKFKTKLLVGILAITLVGGGYVVSQKEGANKQQDVIAQMENSSHVESNEHVENSKQEESELDLESDKSQDIEFVNKLEDAYKAYEEDGMINLYPEFRNREKKKWLELINKNNYFQSDENLQYQIGGLYELGENQYFLLGWAAQADEKLILAEEWSEEQQKNNVPKGIFQLILLQEGENYFVTHSDYPSEAILSSEEVALYKKVEQEASNISIEYNTVHKLKDVEDYVEYLDEAIKDLEEETINENGKGEVTQYVQYAIEDLSSESMVAEENTIHIEQDVLGQMKDMLISAKDKFNELLNKNEINFNKSLNTILRLQAEQASFKKPIYIQLPEQFEDLGEITGLRILFDKNSYIYIEASDLELLAGLKIKIERLRDKSTYEITFLDQNEEVIPQIEASVTFAFPAKDELSTVIADYNEESQNWGGQYDTSSGTISFGTKYSGKYQVIDNSIKIKDIAGLTQRQQSAIKFMVSKGYLNLDDGYFYPRASFTRYEFAQALVKMFFALDTSLTTTFKDVPVESSYYPYVASGETYEIIKGYADQTFKGDIKIPTEQVISLCARTIADKKGYVYPEDIADYIKFADTQDIANWAINDIALAVQSGLITGGGSLLPKEEITKAESAEILYQLFMLLYETSPDEVVEVTVQQKTISIVAVLIMLGMILWLIMRFIKRNKVILTMIACTVAIIITVIIGFKGGF